MMMLTGIIEAIERLRTDEQEPREIHMTPKEYDQFMEEIENMRVLVEKIDPKRGPVPTFMGAKLVVIDPKDYDPLAELPKIKRKYK